MKKCPNCGTILDDSKVKCYMCGTDLQRQSLTNFSNSFNETIGATVSNSQGNVFGQNGSFQGNQNYQTAANQSMNNYTPNTNSNFSNSVYSNQLNNLNSMAYDDRTALEKMFSSDDRFKSKAEINAARAMRVNQKRNSFADAFTNSQMQQQQRAQQQQRQMNNVNNPQQMNNNMMQNNRQQVAMQPKNKKGFDLKGLFKKKKNNQVPIKSKPGFFNQNQMAQQQRPNAPMSNQPMAPNQSPVQQPSMSVQQSTNTANSNQPEFKPPINWGNNLASGANEKVKKTKTSNIKVNPNLVFNIVALVVSICLVLFVYFKVIKRDSGGDKVISFGGLRFSMNNNFKLKDEKSNYRLYSFGDYCSIGMEYGDTNAVDSYVDTLYDSIAKDWESRNYKTNKKIARYNNNVWTEMNVFSVNDNAASSTGYSTETKIQYVAIVYEGKYYTIAYQNTNGDTICSASYDSFLNSLSFE